MLTLTVRSKMFTPMYSCMCFCQSFVTHDTQTPDKKVLSKPHRENFSTTQWKKKAAAKILIDLKFLSFSASFFLFFELKKWLKLLWFHVKTRLGEEDKALWQTWTNNVYITYGEKKQQKFHAGWIGWADILGENRWMLLFFFHHLWKGNEEWKRKFRAFLNKCTK